MGEKNDNEKKSIKILEIPKEGISKMGYQQEVTVRREKEEERKEMEYR